MRGPWGERPPRRPKVGAGRAALARRATARGGGEREASTAAARRGLARGRGNGRIRRRGAPGVLQPVRRGWSRFQQRFLAQRRLRHVLLAVAIAWVAWTFLLGDASLPRLLALRHGNAKLDFETGRLEADQERLGREVDALRKGDRATIELIARDEHAMVKDGEVLVRFYVPEEDDE